MSLLTTLHWPSDGPTWEGCFCLSFPASSLASEKWKELQLELGRWETGEEGGGGLRWELAGSGPQTDRIAGREDEGESGHASGPSLLQAGAAFPRR